MDQDAVAFAVGLELIEVTTGRVLAAEHKMGGARFAGQARQVTAALIEPATDAVVELRAQLDQLRRRGGVGDGLLVALRGKATAELETYLQLLKKHCQRVGQNGAGVEVVGLSATGCPAERQSLLQALRELAGAKNRFVSNQHNVVLIQAIGR